MPFMRRRVKIPIKKGKKYYCFLCGNDLIIKKKLVLKCPKCKRLEQYDKGFHTGKVDGRIYYYINCNCRQETFNKSKFIKGKKSYLYCPKHKTDYIKIEKIKTKDYVLKTEICKPKSDRWFSGISVIPLKTDEISFHSDDPIEKSNIIKTLQLKQGDKLIFKIKKVI